MFLAFSLSPGCISVILIFFIYSIYSVFFIYYNFELAFILDSIYIYVYNLYFN